ncbi:hypothetical protein K7472_31495 [Streptomyces sp. PTM05]|uniref:Uncharacterized protein n=1 Tax=Streptantibioticus parmotrematis TaxID=2873249 RepID=A0ABS7R5K8_9ACTN|nr:hypothetical protein [Streptantibioticus parmotrematis]MBY8889334.1 hypothetical protein [Streptantibioticus parmotrematis]
MTKPLSQQTIQRLAFVRFLHAQGVTQSAQPEPMSAAAILSFQDAVEHFLLIGADHLGVSLPNGMQFLQYWEKLQPKLPPGQVLPSKQALGRVNKLRVDLKHHGNIPSSHAIAQSKADVTTFFTDAARMIFDVDFETVDMADLVAHPKVAQYLRDARTHFEADRVIVAMAGLALAFEELIEHYRSRKTGWGGSPFTFGDRLPIFRAERGERDSPVSRQLKALTSATRQLRQAMQVIALGIDYARYVHFMALTPDELSWGRDGSITFSVNDMTRALTADDYQQARLFVIESALQAARADAILERLDAHFSEDIDYDVEQWTWTGSSDSPG